MFSDLDKNSMFFKIFGEILCPCCKKDKLHCCDINSRSLTNIEFFTCKTCNLFVSFYIGLSLDYYFDLDFYYASNDDYAFFIRRYPYIKRILNNYVKKWRFSDKF